MASRSFSKPRSRRPAILAASIAGFFALWLTPQGARGQTWTGATSGDWNTATNWNPATVPNGGGKIATFDGSSITAVSLSQLTSISGLTFTSNATSPYTISANSGVNFFLFGSIANSSGVSQNFESLAGSRIAFANSASAGSLTQFTTDSATTSGGSVGLLDFSSISTAGSATIINLGGTVAGAGGGSTMFEASAKAGSATITTNGGTNGGYGGATYFAGSADGGTARAITNGNGSFDISWLTSGGMKIGSIEGNGNYYLGANSLAVGGNNLSTMVSGVIADGGIGDGTGGSLIKNGSGTLTLTAANAYTGGTTVNAGTVQLGTAVTAGTLNANSAIGVNSGGTFTIVNVGGVVGSYNTIANNMSNGVGGVGTVDISSAKMNLLTGTLTDGVAGKLGLTQSGSGMTWVLNANNTYSGPTTITAGILQIGDSPIGTNLPGSIGSSSSVNISGGGALWLSNVTGNVFANNVTSSVVGSTGTLNVANSTATPITLSGVLTDTVAGQLTLKVTSGAAIVTGTANSYHGATVVNGGSTLQIGTTAKAGSIGSSTVVDVNNSSTFMLTNVSGNQFSNTITNLTGSGPYPDATVRVDAAGTLTISGVVSDGTGGQLAFTQNGSGTTILTGTNTYTGQTQVNKGTLVVNGSIASGSTMNVSVSGTLSGTGSILGAVNFNGGTLAPGTASTPGTLTVGSLSLIQASTIFRLGTPTGSNDQVNVVGNLSLYNSLTIRPLAGFGVGTYTLFNYGGTLTNGANGISPISGLIGYGSSISTSTSGKVDLVVSYLGGGQFWDGTGAVNDGAIAGGSGNWSAAGNNWTTSTGAGNSTWQSGTAIFGGTAGTVTLTSPINTQAVFFNSNGYVIAGTQALTLVGAASAINVTNAGTAATISAKLAGVAGLTTGGPGTLILTNGSNSYSGGTTVYSGTLQIGTIATAGSLGSGAILVENGGTLNLTNVAGSSVANNISSGIGGVNTVHGGTINTLTLSGTLKDGAAGQLALNVAGTGTLILTNAGNTYSGSTTVSQANLQIGTATAAGSIGTNSATTVRAGGKLTLVNVAGNTLGNSITNDGSGVGTVVANSANSITLSGALTDGVVGQMALTQSGTGTTTLSGTSAYSGATTVSAGTLQIGNGTSGNLTGTSAVTVSGTGILATDLANGATFTPNITLSAAGASVKAIQSGANTLAGLISGTGAFNQNGTGTTILNNNETYTGATTVTTGTLEVDGSLATASVVKVLTGGTLSGAGTIKGNATLTGNGIINFGSGGNIVGTLGITGGNWNGFGAVGGLVTSSSGAFNLAGSLTAPAGLSVTGGTLAGTGTLNGKITYSSATSSTFGGVITGTGTLAKSGASILTLTGDETYTGATTVSAGTLQIGNGSAGSLSGTSGVTVSGTGILATNLVDGSTFAQSITLSATTASLKAIQSGTNTISGVISGTGTFNQSGSGTTILNNNETYTGATTVTTGTLEVDGSLATASVVKVLTGGTLTGTGTIKGNSTLTGNGIVNLGSSGIILGTLGVTGGNWNGLGTVNGLVTSSSGAFNLNNSLTAPAGLSVTGGTLAGTGTLNGKLTYASTASSIFGGVIAGTSTLTKSGTSTLTLTGTEAYTGATTVSGGTLQIGNGTTGDLTSTSGVTASGTGVLAINLPDGSTFTPNITLSAAGASVKAIQSGTNTISGLISGTGGFNQNGSGTTILNKIETYTGATNITTGTLEVDGSLATASVVHVLTAGKLTGTGTIKGNATLTGNGIINFGSGGNIVGTLGVTGGNWNGLGTVGGLVTSSSGAFNLGGSLTAPTGLSITGGTLVGTGTLTGKLTYASTASSTFGGVVAGTGTLTKSGASTLTLTGTNTYTGATTVTAGTLQVGNGAAAGASLGGGNVAVSSGATLAIDLAGGDTFANKVTDTGRITDIAPSGTHTIASTISGTGTFAKTGAGTVVLTGANTYTGATAVSSGTLLANNTTGFATGTGTVSINNGGTLGGSGTVKALTLGSGGILAPGAGSIGVSGTTLHASSLIWNAGGTLKLQLGPSSGDALALTGAFNKGTAGSYTLDLIDAGVAPGSYTLATYASTNFLPSNFTLELPAGYDGSLVQTSTSLSINLSLHASSMSGATLTLNGNPPSGGGVTTLSGGTLSLGTASTYSGGTLIVNGANATTVSGATVTFSGGAGSSTLTPSSANLVLLPQGLVSASGISSTFYRSGTLNLSESPNVVVSDTTLPASENTIASPATITGATLVSGGEAGTIFQSQSIPLTLTPTPEPGSAMLLAFGTSMLIGWRRRRRA